MHAAPATPHSDHSLYTFRANAPLVMSKPNPECGTCNGGIVVTLTDGGNFSQESPLSPRRNRADFTAAIEIRYLLVGLMKTIVPKIGMKT